MKLDSKADKVFGQRTTGPNAFEALTDPAVSERSRASEPDRLEEAGDAMTTEESVCDTGAMPATQNAGQIS